MEKTGIIWTEKTWNPFRALNTTTQKKGWFCQKVNEGCKYCYAETLNLKFGNGLPFTKKSLSEISFYLAATNDPFRWKEPSLVFVNSMTDFFMSEIPDDHRHKVLDIMEDTPQHEYQVLTKRPDLMYRFSLERQMPNNFWAGMTIPNEKARVSGGLDFLHLTKANIKFISAEPIISPIHFTKEDLTGINQVITGGESGAHLWNKEIAEQRALVKYSYEEKKWLPRKDREDWIREIRDICSVTNTCFFHKQWGGHFPEAAGRLLDGRTHNEMPRLAGDKKFIDNDYLKKIEKEIGNIYGKQ